MTNYKWNILSAATDASSDNLDNICDDCVRLVKWHINCSIPARNVSMHERDPPYVTPRIKLLLRKRNKLRRCGRCEDADNIDRKINALIARNRSQVLSGASITDTKKIGIFIKNTGNWGEWKDKFGCDVDAERLNEYFAGVATDPNYNRANVIQYDTACKEGPAPLQF